MNERIRELAEQAGAGWDHKYHWYVGSETMQKFAELIVGECAQTIEAQDVDPSFKQRMSWAIKTRFGIKT